MNRPRLVANCSLLALCLLCLMLFITSAEAQDEVISLENVEQIEELALLGEPATDSSRFISHMAYSADGRFLATASEDMQVRIWQTADGSLLRTIQAVEGVDSFDGLDISPDGEIVAIGYYFAVRLYSTSDGSELNSFSTSPSNFLADFAFSSDGQTLSIVGIDGRVTTWLTRTSPGERLQVYENLTGPVWEATFSEDGQLLATAADDHSIRIWRVEDGTLQATLAGHTQAVYSLAFSSDGQSLASSAVDDTIRLWRTTDGANLWTVINQGGNLAFSPDGQILSSSSCCDVARLWRVSDGTPAAVLGKQGTYGSLALAFSPDGKILAIGKLNGSVQLLGISQSGGDAIPEQPISISALPSNIPISPDNAGQVIKLAQWASPGVDELAYSPDSGLLAFAMSTGVSVRDADTLEEVRFLETLLWSHSVDFSPDGETIAAGFLDGSIWLWRVDDGGLIATYHEHTDIVTALDFSPDGQFLASSSDDGTVQIRHVADGALVNTLDEIPETIGYGYITDVEFSPEGSLIAASAYIGSGIESTTMIYVWSVGDGSLLRDLSDVSEETIWGMTFSPDGESLLAATHYQVRGWTVPSFDRLYNYKNSLDWGIFLDQEFSDLGFSDLGSGMPYLAWSVAYSFDGQLLAIGAKGGIQLLRGDGTPLAILQTKTDPNRIVVPLSQNVFSLAFQTAANSVVFSPNGLTLASSSSDGTVQLWGISGGEPPIAVEPTPLEVATIEPTLVESTAVDSTPSFPTTTPAAEPPNEAEAVAGSGSAEEAAAPDDIRAIDEGGALLARNQTRPILLGVMAVSGAAFLLGLGALVWRGRKR